MFSPKNQVNSASDRTARLKDPSPFSSLHLTSFHTDDVGNIGRASWLCMWTAHPLLVPVITGLLDVHQSPVSEAMGLISGP